MSAGNYNTGSHRLRVGWLDNTQLGPQYAITNWPKQTGQGRAKWFRPTGSPHFNQGDRVEKSLSGDGRYIGLRNFAWTLKGLLPQMVNYIANDDAVFGGFATRRFTVMTWNPTDNTWPILWSIGTLGVANQVAERGWRQGYLAYTISFDVDQDAPAP